MFDHQISRFEKRIADLPDQPTLAPDALKAWFDSAPEQLRQALNRVCADGHGRLCRASNAATRPRCCSRQCRAA